MIDSLRMIFRECKCKHVGIAGYAEAFSFVLSRNQTSEGINYLFFDVLEEQESDSRLTAYCLYTFQNQ